MNDVKIDKSDVALGDAEIASIIEASKKASYQKSQKDQPEIQKILLHENLSILRLKLKPKKSGLEKDKSELTLENQT